MKASKPILETEAKNSLLHITKSRLTSRSVQEDEGPLRCNPSFQKQHHATKK